MSLTSIGDLTQSFLLGRVRVDLSQRMQRLSAELASGEIGDLAASVSGQFGALADIERRLDLGNSFGTATTEAASDARAMQASLTRIQTDAQSLAGRALTAGASASGAATETVVREAQGTLHAVVDALNTRVAGRTLFAGAEVASPALATAGEIRDALRLALTGASGPADILARAHDFFELPSGPFRTSLYQGGATGPTPRRLDDGELVALDIRADDAALRAQIRTTTLISLASDPVLGLDAAGQRSLLSAAGTDLQAAQPALAELRGTLGSAEERIDRAAARIAAEASALKQARNDIVSADPFETAIELERVQFQLETILTLTARSSRLNLATLLS